MATTNPYKGTNTIAPPKINTIGDYNNQVQQTQPTAQVQPTPPPIDTDSQPSGIGNLDNGTLNHIRKSTGWDDNKINSVYGKEYDPNSGDSYLSTLYAATKKKPRELTPEQENKARITSNIGEALGTLGEMYSAGRGARVASRDFSNGPAAQTERKINDVRNLYLAQQDQYDNGLLNAKMQDYQTGKHQFDVNRHEVTNAIREKRAMEVEARKQAAEYAKWLREQGLKESAETFNQWKGKQEIGLKDKEIKQRDVQFTATNEENVRTHKANEHIGSRNASNGRISANAAMINALKPRVGSTFNFGWERDPKTGKEVGSVAIPAHPNDNGSNVTVDQFGVRSKTINITPEQLDQYSLAGKNDMEFMALHPELTPQIKDSRGDMQRVYAKKEEIGPAYMKYMDDKKYQQQPQYVNEYLPNGSQSPIKQPKTIEGF